MVLYNILIFFSSYVCENKKFDGRRKGILFRGLGKREFFAHQIFGPPGPLSGLNRNKPGSVNLIPLFFFGMIFINLMRN